MTATQVLREAFAVVQRDHTAVQLAVDVHGDRVRNPLAPSAAAWSTVGALIKVAPANAKMVAEHKAPGHIGAAWEAFLLLTEAATQQGYGGDCPTVYVDRAGPAAVANMFMRALQLADDEPRARRRPAAGIGSSPRGTDAV